MKYNKRAEFPVIKTILMLLISITILVTYMLILSSASIELNDKKLNSQLVLNSIFSSNCFSDKYGVVDINKFTKENANSCFNLGDKVLVRLKIDYKGMDNNIIYIGNENDFKSKSQLCNLRSRSILCSKLIYPIEINLGNGKFDDTKITVHILAE